MTVARRCALVFAAPLLAIAVAEAAEFPSRSLTDGQTWRDAGFLAAWQPQTSPSTLSHRTFPSKAPIFGHQPHFITGLFEDGRLESLSIVFLDSGTFFGYVAQGANAADARSRQEAFDELFKRVRRDVVAGLEELSGHAGKPVVLGEEPMLSQEALVFAHGDRYSRLLAVEGQLIKLTVFDSEEKARAYVPPATRDRIEDRRGWEDAMKARVNVNADGDHLLEEIPLFPQGNRAYCGVSTLAMAMQYLGLPVETEEYAAAAGIRYGSAKGAKVREVYHASAEEAGLRLSRSTRFDFRKTQESIDAGIPVIVWRRFSFDRDYLHSNFARRYQSDKTAELPKPDLNDQATWPDKNAPTHASIIVGYHADRREVIFSESWGEYARRRRMREEEMEGTAYYTFFARQ